MAKKFKRLASGKIKYRGETFAGFNKPKTTPSHPKKSHIVLAKKEIQFDNEVTSWNNWKKGYTKFQYMLWITPEEHEKAVKKYNEKWGFLSNV